MRKIETFILGLATQYLKLLRYLSYALNVLAGLTLFVWLLKIKVTRLENIELEALFAILSGVAVFLNQIYRRLFEETEYSPADALAFGYVNNFLLPVITQLKENGESNPVLYVYKPERINELLASNIDIIKAELKNKSYTLAEVNLNLKQARARDILTVQKSSDKQVYFDFPNTLLSLLNYIDYKIDSKANHSCDNVKVELGSKLISEFYEKVNELVVENRLAKSVKYCDANLKLF